MEHLWVCKLFSARLLKIKAVQGGPEAVALPPSPAGTARDEHLGTPFLLTVLPDPPVAISHDRWCRHDNSVSRGVA